MNPGDTQGARGSAGAPWRRPQSGISGLERYFRTLHERLPLIVAVTLVTTLAAVLYLAVASDQYRAEADLLVTPVSQNDTALTGLPLIRESSDPTRDVETAARLVVTRAVAVRAKAQLNLSDGPNLIQQHDKADPVAQSNLVAITATAHSTTEAR